jgi:uncharacterized protein YgiM (DUF1202 family)
MNWRRSLQLASRPVLESASRPVLELASRRALDLALAALLAAVVWPSAAFADGAAVKCAPNEERVWLYDSVTSLNVETKLKCGESVEVIGQQSGYMKVRTANGTEGFLPESNLPKPAASAEASGAQPIPGAPPTLASLARAAAARRAAAAPAAAPTATPSNASVAPPAGAVNASPAMQPKTVAAVAAAPAPTSVLATAPVSATPVSSTVSSTGATPAAAIPATAHPSTTAAAHAKPKAAAKSTTTAVTTSTKPVPVNPSGPATSPAPRTSTSAPLHVAAATPAPKAPSAQPAAVVATDIYVGGPADVYVGGTSNNGSAPKAAANAPKVRTVAATSDDDDDSYLTRPKNESEDPSCQTYFSGYGLSPGQFKWLEDNRVKKYPSVCPAASPAMVDYVIIFTHDVDFFNYTMPAPVHYEAGGFSDWTPILQYDTSVVSHSDIDKSKREYVWVFHVKRGAFDPNKFSPHRRFQYTKSESKYSRTVEDAFEFIGGQGAER